MEEQFIVKQEQKTKTKHELGRKQVKIARQHIAEILKGKLTKDWTIKDGRVEVIDGRWLTPRELLEEVKAQMRLRPELYNQAAAVDETNKNDCGTICCIGGWIELLATGKDNVAFETINEFLTGKQRWPWLFDASWDSGDTKTGDPGEIYAKYANATTGAERVEAACEAIDLFIKTEGIK